MAVEDTESPKGKSIREQTEGMDPIAWAKHLDKITGEPGIEGAQIGEDFVLDGEKAHEMADAQVSSETKVSRIDAEDVVNTEIQRFLLENGENIPEDWNERVKSVAEDVMSYIISELEPILNDLKLKRADKIVKAQDLTSRVFAGITDSIMESPGEVAHQESAVQAGAILEMITSRPDDLEGTRVLKFQLDQGLKNMAESQAEFTGVEVDPNSLLDKFIPALNRKRAELTVSSRDLDAYMLQKGYIWDKDSGEYHQ